MFRINPIIFCLLTVISGYSQNDTLFFFNKQKAGIDSIIAENDQIDIRKMAITGGDSLAKKYNGSVFIHISDNRIIKIELAFDSSQSKTTLYCTADKIIKISENDGEFYCVDNYWYRDNIKETSLALLKKMTLYKQVFDIALLLFPPDN